MILFDHLLYDMYDPDDTSSVVKPFQFSFFFTHCSLVIH